MRRVWLCILALAMCASLFGCAPTGMYDWGSYETSVLNVYTDPSAEQRDKDRRKLIDEVRKTELKGTQRVPPGKYAQIGYLWWQDGDTAAARTYFQAERDAYPEGAVLMDALLRRLQ
jgi:hypothetical protein